jgi:alcohol dehydrogenase class IV
MMQFEFATASKIIFGPGRLDGIADIARELGSRTLVISRAPNVITEKLLNLLIAGKITYTIVEVTTEPTVETITHALNTARSVSPELVIGIGGGSVLDTAKATAALYNNPGEITEYLEVIGQNKTLTQPALPLIAIPTTSGTGAEVTKNTVIVSTKNHVKISIRSSFLLPKVALVDPQLTLSVPPQITAYTGLDTLTQLIEPYTCNNPNPLTDAICVEGIKRVSGALSRAYDDGTNIQAREDMALASLFSGLALANARLGAVHGLAGPIGGLIQAPHGAICAALLAGVTKANIEAIISREPDNPSLARYTTLGKLLSDKPNATYLTAIEWVSNICHYMNIRPLSSFGLEENHFPEIIERAIKASSMKGNPITLSGSELRIILQRAM